MKCNQCWYQWCWLCGDKWTYYGHKKSYWSLIRCDLFGFSPSSSTNKLKWWLYFLAIIIFSPLIVIIFTVALSLSYVRLTRFWYKFDGYYSSLQTRVFMFFLALPWNLLILSLDLAIAFSLAAIVTPIVTPYFIYVNIYSFVKIMKYWSNGKRFKAVKNDE